MLYSTEKWKSVLSDLRGDKEVIRYAEQAMRAELYTVTKKTHKLPDGGTPNDYVSIGPYWWPDPDTPNGLPWIRRDGETNPVFYEYDSKTLYDFVTDTGSLLLGGLANGREEWINRAVQQIECWFIAPETKMNPNLRFGQFVPGRCDGRCFGIIDAKELFWIFELLELLPLYGSWTQEKLDAVRAWSGEMVKWLLTHPLGIEEGNTKNNHSVSYDCMVTMMAIFAGDRETAVHQIRDCSIPRIAKQFAEDGSLPLELARTDSKGYSVFCLYCFFMSACLGKRLGIAYPDEMLRRGLAWLEKNIDSENWHWQQLYPYPKSSMAILYGLAGEFLEDDALIQKARSLAEKPWTYLLYWRRSR